MRRDDTFKDFVLDQLSELDALVCRPMFGGYGLYVGATFFAILSDGRLYFRTNDETREPYLRRNMDYFRPNPRQGLKNYYEVPPEVVEDSEQLVAWARRAIQLVGAD